MLTNDAALGCFESMVVHMVIIHGCIGKQYLVGIQCNEDRQCVQRNPEPCDPSKGHLCHTPNTNRSISFDECRQLALAIGGSSKWGGDDYGFEFNPTGCFYYPHGNKYYYNQNVTNIQCNNKNQCIQKLSGSNVYQSDFGWGFYSMDLRICKHGNSFVLLNNSQQQCEDTVVEAPRGCFKATAGHRTVYYNNDTVGTKDCRGG